MKETNNWVGWRDPIKYGPRKKAIKLAMLSHFLTLSHTCVTFPKCEQV